jgi:uncharacterized protein YggE
MNSRKITVQGQGKAKGTPDKATISVTIRTVQDTATGARESHAPAVQKINAAILNAGVKSEDIQSSRFAFGQNVNYNRKTGENEVKGFYASNTVSVRIRDLKKVSELLDAAAKGGATNIDGPNLQISEPRALEDEARKAAYEDARKKADLYATAAGLTLGKVLEMSEDTRAHHLAPAAAAALAEAEADEIQVGEMEVTINLNVVFEVLV